MSRSRAFTILEILMALTVSAIVLSMAVIAARAQERSYYSGNRVRAAQNAVREALLVLERKIPMAGYGMDAPFAFDYQWYKPSSFGTCPTELDPCAPDSIGNSDEITFYARNPAYWVSHVFGAAVDAEPKGKAWSAVGLHGDTLTIKAHLDDQFRKGQILQLVCAGELAYAYFTVNSTVPPSPVSAEGTQVSISLQPVDVSNPFLRQDVAVNLSCFSDPTTASNAKTNAKVFQIDRYRFHVRPVALGGVQYDPYLMLDQGVDTDLDGDVDADDELFIAEGIESIQFAYVFADRSIPVAGTTRSTPVAFVAGTPSNLAETVTKTLFHSPTPLPAGKNDYDYSAFFAHSTLSPPAERKTNAQANLSRIQVSVVARSPEAELTGTPDLEWTTGSNLFRQNQSAAPTWITAAAKARGTDGYQRAIGETGVALPNMLTRSMTYF